MMISLTGPRPKKRIDRAVYKLLEEEGRLAQGDIQKKIADSYEEYSEEDVSTSLENLQAREEAERSFKDGQTIEWYLCDS